MKSARSLLNHHCSKNRLSCYLDGQLSDRQAARVREHLSECSTCRDDLESLRATIALLKATPTPCMPRSVTIPESAVAEQCQTRHVDTVFSALRVSAVAVTLMLAVLLSQDVIRAVRPANLQTVAVEMASDSGPALEGAGGGPGVLREAPVEREAALEAEPVSTVAVEQVQALAAAKSAESATDAAEEDVTAPEALSLMAAPVVEGTASMDASAIEPLEPAEEVTEEAVASDLEASDLEPSVAMPEMSAARDSALAKNPAAEQPKIWTPSGVAAAILAGVLVSLIGALLWVGRRRVTL